MKERDKALLCIRTSYAMLALLLDRGKKMPDEERLHLMEQVIRATTEARHATQRAIVEEVSHLR